MNLLHGLISRGILTNDEHEGRVEISSFVFNNINDVRNFLETNEVASVGIYWDLCSTLVSMKPKFLSGKERADEVHSSVRTATTNQVNDLSASMTHPRPNTLFGKQMGALVPLRMDREWV